LTAPGQATAAGGDIGFLHFAACPAGSGVDHTTGCAGLKVPLDYSHPKGRKISLTVALKLASGTAAQRQGVLFVNPGGPGASALPLVSSVGNELPQALQEAYDVVGVDPRGVGYSTPLSCGLERLYRPPLPNFVPHSRRAEGRMVARARATARACGRHSRALLAHLNTSDTARDMDAVRAALGESQINYLGYSYGTYLGEVYGQLFPARVRRMILDSVIDPGETNYHSAFAQDRAFEARLGDFFTWIARRNHTYLMGTSARSVGYAWRAIRHRLIRHPAGGKVGPSELDEATSQALYGTPNWPDLAAALADYRRGHPAALVDAGHILAAATGAASLAVTCRDSPWPTAWSRWHSDARNIFRSAPLTAWESTWASAPCAFWPVAGGPLVPVTGAGVPSVLLLQAARDPATPVGGARRARALYGSRARMVLAAGGNHGQYLFDGNKCLNRFGTDYLRTGALPAHDARCHRATGSTSRALSADRHRLGRTVR
jgi:pimeloyl-ACP methyl ester carboxylesterase